MNNATQVKPPMPLTKRIGGLKLSGERFAKRIEKSPLGLLIGLSCVYLAMIWLPVQRRFWFDELFTFYISSASSLRQLFADIRHVDLHPPLLYLFTRAAQAAFGANEIATRLPAVLAFWGASVLLVRYLAARVGLLWAWASVLLFWCSGFFYYATEARPYSLLLFFFSLVLFSRDLVCRFGVKPLPLAGVFAGACGLMVSHVFAPFTLLAFGAAELIRFWRRGEADWPLWMALFLPVVVFPFQLFLIHQAGAAVYPVAFQASPAKISAFYQGIFQDLALLTGLAAVLGFSLLSLREGRPLQQIPISGEDHILFGVLCASPVLVNLALMANHGPFFDRYCITAAMAIAAGTVVAIARATRLNRFAGLAVLLLFAISCLDTRYLKPLSRSRKAKHVASKLESQRPDLPMVMASGLTFVEADHYSDPTFLSRVYYLTDADSAFKYAHATQFEGLQVAKKYLPIRSNVVPYGRFVEEHRQFLVLGTVKYPEDWLLRKLIAEKVPMRLIGTFAVPYKDKSLYLVDFTGHSGGGTQSIPGVQTGAHAGS